MTGRVWVTVWVFLGSKKVCASQSQLQSSHQTHTHTHRYFFFFSFFPQWPSKLLSTVPSCSWSHSRVLFLPREAPEKRRRLKWENKRLFLFFPVQSSSENPVLPYFPPVLFNTNVLGPVFSLGLLEPIIQFQFCFFSFLFFHSLVSNCVDEEHCSLLDRRIVFQSLRSLLLVICLAAMFSFSFHLPIFIFFLLFSSLIEHFRVCL